MFMPKTGMIQTKPNCLIYAPVHSKYLRPEYQSANKNLTLALLTYFIV